MFHDNVKCPFCKKIVPLGLACVSGNFIVPMMHCTSCGMLTEVSATYPYDINIVGGIRHYIKVHARIKAIYNGVQCIRDMNKFLTETHKWE